jgi:hypothetical protein
MQGDTSRCIQKVLEESIVCAGGSSRLCTEVVVDTEQTQTISARGFGIIDVEVLCGVFSCLMKKQTSHPSCKCKFYFYTTDKGCIILTHTKTVFDDGADIQYTPTPDIYVSVLVACIGALYCYVYIVV